MRTTAVIRVPLVQHAEVQALVDSLNEALRPELVPRSTRWSEAEIYRRAVAKGLPAVLAELAAAGGGP